MAERVHSQKDERRASPLQNKPFQLSTSPRIIWALAMLWNARGIGTPWQIGRIPSVSKSHTGVGSPHSHELRRHAQAFIISYLVLDVFSCLPPPDIEAEMSADKQRLLTRMGEINAGEAIFRATAVLGFWANTFCAIHLINSAFFIVQLLLNLQPVAMLPPIWGSLSDAYSIRNFWG